MTDLADVIRILKDHLPKVIKTVQQSNTIRFVRDSKQLWAIHQIVPFEQFEFENSLFSCDGRNYKAK